MHTYNLRETNVDSYVLVEKQALWSAGAVRILAAPEAPCWQAAVTFRPPAATFA